MSTAIQSPIQGPSPSTSTSPNPTPIQSPRPNHLQKEASNAADIKLEFIDEVLIRLALISPSSTRAPSVCSPTRTSPTRTTPTRTRIHSAEEDIICEALEYTPPSSPEPSPTTIGKPTTADLPVSPKHLPPPTVIKTLGTLLEVQGDDSPLSYNPVCVNGSTIKQTPDGSFQDVLRAQVNESLKHKGQALVVMANGASMIDTEMATGKGYKDATDIVNASCSVIEPMVDTVITSSNDPSAVEQVTVDELCKSKENKPLLDYFMDRCNQDLGLKQLMNELLRDLYDQRAEMRNRKNGHVDYLFKKNMDRSYIQPLEVRANGEAKKRLNSLRDAIMPEVFCILFGISYKGQVYKGMDYIVNPSYLEKGRANSGMGLIAACAKKMRLVLLDMELPSEFYERLNLPGHIKLYTRDDTPPKP